MAAASTPISEKSSCELDWDRTVATSPCCRARESRPLMACESCSSRGSGVSWAAFTLVMSCETLDSSWRTRAIHVAGPRFSAPAPRMAWLRSSSASTWAAWRSSRSAASRAWTSVSADVAMSLMESMRSPWLAALSVCAATIAASEAVR